MGAGSRTTTWPRARGRLTDLKARSSPSSSSRAPGNSTLCGTRVAVLPSICRSPARPPPPPLEEEDEAASAAARRAGGAHRREHGGHLVGRQLVEHLRVVRRLALDPQHERDVLDDDAHRPREDAQQRQLDAQPADEPALERERHAVGHERRLQLQLLELDVLREVERERALDVLREDVLQVRLEESWRGRGSPSAQEACGGAGRGYEEASGGAERVELWGEGVAVGLSATICEVVGVEPQARARSDAQYK